MYTDVYVVGAVSEQTDVAVVREVCHMRVFVDEIRQPLQLH